MIAAVVVITIVTLTLKVFFQPSPAPAPAPTPSPAQAPTPTPPPKPPPTKHMETIANLHDYRLESGHYYYSDETIQADTRVSISWEADGTVSVYILTETQYDYFKQMGLTARYVAYDQGSRGKIIEDIQNTDVYYLIIKNPSLFEAVKIYSAKIELTW